MAKMKDASEKGWGSDPHGRVGKAPAAHKGGSEVGPERKANMQGVLEGGSRAEGADPIRSTGGYGGVGETHLRHAVHELEKQHPHHHSAGGIHGTKDHHRHEPMHGLRPHKGHH